MVKEAMVFKLLKEAAIFTKTICKRQNYIDKAGANVSTCYEWCREQNKQNFAQLQENTK